MHTASVPELDGAVPAAGSNLGALNWMPGDRNRHRLGKINEQGDTMVKRIDEAYAVRF